VAGSGISGLSVGIITAGGLLVYAGIRGVTPLQALRDVSSGQPVAIPNVPGQQIAVTDGTGGNVAQSVSTGTVKGHVRGAAALTAANAFTGDKYSQLLRTRPGYSDCSSFVDKAFHAVGIDKPDGRMAWPNTTAFMNSPAWKTIPQSLAVPGDIAVAVGGGLGHMTFVTNTGGTQGLGQQNSHSNVRTGAISSLFSGVNGTVVFRTYVGTGT
jgi:cell wall-associated NlpC family hydrolase